MRTIRAAAALCAALLLLAGCSDDTEPRDPASTATPTSTPDSPTSSATAAPVEPRLPTAAKKATEDGARTFITYYWDLINYAQLTGDVKALRKVSGPACDGCRGGIKAITDVYRNGGHAEGGQYTIRIKRLQQARFETGDAFAYEGRATIRNAKQTITDADGSVRTLESSDNTVDIYVLWVSTRWRMDVVVVR